MSNPERRLAILVGGRSTEHDTSLLSYRSVLHDLHARGRLPDVQVVAFACRDGTWRVHFPPVLPISPAKLDRGVKMTLGRVVDTLQRVDGFILNLLHGNEGEDGAWQGLAEMADLRGSFGGLRGACLSMDKWTQSLLASAVCHAIRVPQTFRLTATTTDEELAGILQAMQGGPVVVKPNSMGASHFAERVHKPTIETIRKKAEAILPFDPLILVQRYVRGREITCGCVERGGAVAPLPLVEIVTSGGFLGHAQKHRVGGMKAELVEDDPGLGARIQAVSRYLFGELGLSGMGSFDFIAGEDGNLYFLEANAIPSLVPGGPFAVMLDAVGADRAELVDWLVEAAAARKPRRKKLVYTIEPGGERGKAA